MGFNTIAFLSVGLLYARGAILFHVQIDSLLARDHKKICSHCGLKKHKNHEIEEIGYVGKEERETLVKEVVLINRPYMTHPALATVCNGVRSEFERCLKLTDGNLLKAKTICADVVGNNYMTEDMIKKKLDEAKKINDLVAKDYEEINSLKEALHNLQMKLSEDITTRI